MDKANFSSLSASWGFFYGTLLKRGIAGQFHHVSRRHLQKYVDEFCYRYNLRKADKEEAFLQTINLGLGVQG